jgi:nucleotide-binding universal stress UspA family protein
VRVEHRLEEGDVADAILRVAHEAPCDLIVMGSREATWPGRLLARGVAEEVGRKAPCPVLTVTTPRPGDAGGLAGSGPGEGDVLQGGAILHPTDFSQAARFGFEVARSLARESGSELIVTHVAPIPALHRKGGYREEVAGALRRLVESDPTVRMRWLLLADDPAAEVLWMAREGWCDLIVMGTRGRGRVRAALLGSTTVAVLGRGHVPVLVARAPRPHP